VKISGSNRKGRINEAFDRENPTRLVQTIQENFGVPIDHYVEVDFCAFKSLVDAVGGVRVPFEFPARDRQTGLDVPAGCVLLDGTDALRYVRSRYYEYDPGGGFRQDGTSDYGRIARQQDFIRRALQRAIDRGARNPSVAKSLLDTALANVRVDQNLTINDMLGLAGSLRTLDPQTVRSFRIEGRGTNIGGASVILPDVSSERARAILDVFKGAAILGDLPGDQVVAEPATTAPPGTVTLAPRTSAGSVTSSVVPAPTVPVVDPQQPVSGIVPPNDPTCR
jgi:LCP family protein required for cell wall assembly